jgi:hypothetical protein
MTPTRQARVGEKGGQLKLCLAAATPGLAYRCLRYDAGNAIDRYQRRDNE